MNGDQVPAQEKRVRFDISELFKRRLMQQKEVCHASYLPLSPYFPELRVARKSGCWCGIMMVVARRSENCCRICENVIAACTVYTEPGRKTGFFSSLHRNTGQKVLFCSEPKAAAVFYRTLNECVMSVFLATEQPFLIALVHFWLNKKFEHSDFFSSFAHFFEQNSNLMFRSQFPAATW